MRHFRAEYSQAIFFLSSRSAGVVVPVWMTQLCSTVFIRLNLVSGEGNIFRQHAAEHRVSNDQTPERGSFCLASLEPCLIL